MSAGSEPHGLLGLPKSDGARNTRARAGPGSINISRGAGWPANGETLAPACVFSALGKLYYPRCRYAYSAMVRSLEKFPEPATFRMALRAQAF